MQAGPLVFHSLLHGSIFLPLSRHPLNAIKMPLDECRNGNCYATGTATKTAVTYATGRNSFQFVSIHNICKSIKLLMVYGIDCGRYLKKCIGSITTMVFKKQSIVMN